MGEVYSNARSLDALRVVGGVVVGDLCARKRGAVRAPSCRFERGAKHRRSRRADRTGSQSRHSSPLWPLEIRVGPLRDRLVPVCARVVALGAAVLLEEVASEEVARWPLRAAVQAQGELAVALSWPWH